MTRVSRVRVRATVSSLLFVLVAGACSRGGSQAPASAPAAMRGGASPVTSPQPQMAPPAETVAPQAVEAPGGPRSGGTQSTGGAASPRSGSSNPFDEHGTLGTNVAPDECQSDGDCLCGIDRASGACAVGPSSRIDTDRQCPDFCSGIGGQLRIVCTSGRCAQTR